MKNKLIQFQLNLARARDLCGLAGALQVQTTGAIDVTDLYRSAVVLATSAFDHFVHEVTREGMLEVAAGKRKATDAYLRFQVSLRAAHDARLASNLDWLDQEIRDRHGWLSFQDPDKLADALRKVTPKRIWEEIAIRLGTPASDARTQLKLIVDRRNKIAHEADADPTVPGVRWPITVAIVDDCITYFDNIARAIEDVLSSP